MGSLGLLAYSFTCIHVYVASNGDVIYLQLNAERGKRRGKERGKERKEEGGIVAHNAFDLKVVVSTAVGLYMSAIAMETVHSLYGRPDCIK